MAQLTSAAADSALQTLLLSRLRLCELTFATRRRRMIHDTVASMQRSAQLHRLRLCVRRWRAAVRARERRDSAVDEWRQSTLERRRHAALHWAIAQWLTTVHRTQVGALLRARRERRLLRFVLSQWGAALALCEAQEHLALLLHRRQCHHDTRAMFAHWRRRWVEAQRRRRLEALHAEWRVGRERGLKLRALRRWQRWWARRVECQRRVEAVMRESEKREPYPVKPALLFRREDA